MRRILCLAGLVVVGAVLVSAPSATAAGGQCTGTMTGTINGNVLVPPGASCLLSAAHVIGSVTVGAGATLTGTGSTIDQNLSATDAANVLFLGGHIGGNVAITGLTGGGCASGLGANTITGNVTYANSAAGSSFFEIGGGTCGGTGFANTIGGNVNISGNQGAVQLNGDGATGGNNIGGSVVVAHNTGGGMINSNTIAHNLTCNANVPAYSATGNSVGGANNC
jgi:hypothetical protein